MSPDPAPAVISGVFADLRLVKTRSVAALVIEIPIERAAEAIAIFGVPQPGQEIPVALARLDPAAVSRPEGPRPEKTEATAAVDAPRPPDPARSERARDAYWSKTPADRAPKRAGILCADPKFWRVLEKAIGRSRMIDSERDATYALYEFLNIESRADLATDEVARTAFEQLDYEYKVATGQAAERRG